VSLITQLVTAYIIVIHVLSTLAEFLYYHCYYYYYYYYHHHLLTSLNFGISHLYSKLFAGCASMGCVLQTIHLIPNSFLLPLQLRTTFYLPHASCRHSQSHSCLFRHLTEFGTAEMLLLLIISFVSPSNYVSLLLQ
jgi:hypothetical protein